VKIIFSNHAILKIEQRKLSRAKILETIARSDFKRPSYGGREELFRRFGKNYLKVVIVQDGETVVVVTAHRVVRTQGP
jgi:hypothetical protein